MKLRTNIDKSELAHRIGYQDRILAIGSCFAQSIGERLARSKFSISVNPTGVLFNPLSITASLARLHAREYISIEELSQGALGWYHLDFHSSLNGQTEQQALEQINRAITEGAETLESANWVILTLGTAWIYERADTGDLVANCHKEPARNFNRRRASLEQIVASLRTALNTSLEGKRVILTLSPIRHLADGLEQNSLSKATLRLAIEEVVSEEPERIFYLPSYEILMDDLRDYRFYCEDMVHPSPLAVEYIWQYFCEVALTPSAQGLLPRVERIVKASQHRVTNPQSEAHKTHCKAQLQAISFLKEVDMSKEMAYFSEMLK